MKSKPILHAVEQPAKEPDSVKPPRADLVDYEHQHRQHIALTNWAAVHVASDRRAPVWLPDTRRGWSK